MRRLYPAIGSRSEILLTRLYNLTAAFIHSGGAEEDHDRLEAVMDVVEAYLGEVDQFVEKMHRRDMGG